MEINELIREFRYNGVKLADPAASFNLVQVRDFYANVYPEIISADVEGPEQIGTKAIYTFRRAVGTKGGHSLGDMVRDLAELLHVNFLAAADAEFVKDVQETLQDMQARHEVTAIPAEIQLRLLALHRAHCEAKAA
jgi:PRTRC genetic system protein C